MSLSANISASADEHYHAQLAELLGKVGERDRGAFSDLYDRVSGALLALALTLLNDRAEAEDVLQEVFLTVWNRAGSYDPGLGKAITWLMTVTRNRSYDRIRATKRKRKAVERAAGEADVLGTAGHEGSQESTNERAGRIESVLHALPDAQREAIELAFLHGYTQTEVAERLAEPLGTVKARIRRGMLRLKELLSTPETPDP